MDGYCFQTDGRELPTHVHAGYPVWTRLELAAMEPKLPQEALASLLCFRSFRFSRWLLASQEECSHDARHEGNDESYANNPP